MKRNDRTESGNPRGGNRHPLASKSGRARKQGGQAILELALVLPVLLLLTLGVIEFGRAFYYTIEVSDAARAGAQYGAQSLADAESIQGITQAALNSAPDVSGLTVSNIGQTCGCPGAAAGACPASGCTYPLVYVTVTTLDNFNTLFGYPGIPSVITLTGVSTMPVQRQ